MQSMLNMSVCLESLKAPLWLIQYGKHTTLFILEYMIVKCSTGMAFFFLLEHMALIKNYQLLD